MQDYLSDWTRLRKASNINDHKRIIIDDKLLFHHKNEDNKHVMPIVAITKDRKLFKIDNSKFIELEGEESFGPRNGEYYTGRIERSELLIKRKIYI